jgi:hypothetical protein
LKEVSPLKSVLLYSLLVAFALCASQPARADGSQVRPDLRGLEQVSQLPPELPQRVMGLAYDGEKLWASVYHGGGRYASLNPHTLGWEVSQDDARHKVIAEVAGMFESPGALCFAEGRLWVAGSYGDSFGSIDTQGWKVERLFKGLRKADRASQSYASMAYDGAHLWMVWHWFKYKLPTSETQLLLKVEPETGRVVGQYPAPAGTRNDGTHGLAWDGARLWHMKDKRLSAIDPSTGGVTAQYKLEQLRRPSGLAWDGQSLWIAEFDGKIWRLPFRSVFSF